MEVEPELARSRHGEPRRPAAGGKPLDVQLRTQAGAGVKAKQNTGWWGTRHAPGHPDPSGQQRKPFIWSIWAGTGWLKGGKIPVLGTQAVRQGPGAKVGPFLRLRLNGEHDYSATWCLASVKRRACRTDASSQPPCFLGSELKTICLIIRSTVLTSLRLSKSVCPSESLRFPLIS